MKIRLCGIMIAAQSLGAWFAVAQTATHPATKQRSSTIQVNPAPTAAVVTRRAEPAIAVSPRNLEFAAVTVGKTTNLSFTVQNTGGGILSGTAKASGPFTIVSGNPYTLGSSQSQVITVQYVPETAGMNVTVIRLTGGGGATIIVAGSALPAPPAPAAPAAPAQPLNLRMIAGR